MTETVKPDGKRTNKWINKQTDLLAEIVNVNMIVVGIFLKIVSFKGVPDEHT